MQPRMRRDTESDGVHLVFKDVCVQVDKTDILKKVSGVARPGDILAVMGPSGSGKTTLLNLLAGRQELDAGDILLDGVPISKKQRRRICYILQEDIFFANLTLRQTLTYTAMLRLPGKMAYNDKISRVHDLVDTLDLRKCLDTRIGSILCRGLSGGEKKRANIASELLTNPELMLLDEPTSGLDSSTAYSLMTNLKVFTQQYNKTTVVTIHQPSSQIFHMFDNILLLSEGENAYFGDAHKILDFFNTLGLPCTPNYNPADFILEKIKDEEHVRTRIVEAAYAMRRERCWPTELAEATTSSYQGTGSECVKPESQPLLEHLSTCEHSRRLQNGSSGSVCINIDRGQQTHQKQTKVSQETAGDDACTECTRTAANQSSTVKWTTANSSNRWPTSFWTQFIVLTTRNFVQSRARILSKLNIVQTVALAFICGLVWFQIENTEKSIQDKKGYLFFTMVYWSFVPMFDGLSAFPDERVVINKERMAGSYRLSAYYFAKMFSELPLIVSLPTLFLLISYPMAGLNGFVSFTAMWSTLILSSLVSQSAGLFFGASTMDFTTALACASIYGLGIMLIGGFYNSELPDWLLWCQFLSHITYSYQAAVQYEFTDGPKIRCGPTNTTVFAACRSANITSVPSESLLVLDSIDWPVYQYYFVLLTYMVLIRSLGYIVLRFFRKPK